MSAGLMAYVWEGLRNTLLLTVFGALLGLAFAFIAGLARTSKRKTVRAIAMVYTEVFRGFPSLVLLFALIFIIPQFGYQLNPLFAGILALALNIGAYAAEVVRGAIRAVPPGQIEAAVALNFTPMQRMRKVVLPQAVVAMIPPFTNNLIELLKQTSLVSLVYISDLTFSAQLIRASTGETALVFFGLLVGYGVIAFVFVTIMKLLERMAARSLGRKVSSGLFGAKKVAA
ncbi:ectoine/hydroxyectoine ABC transporter permease subunit EhuC [Prauserella marina]|uniref:Polar amino acid transport system permease protein n=1 Tax=Prauserella marina TaxID=530584 RepID=A0A222VV18_9PSEU|nr:ectoine/hydroxyectoine ABC transporter permease subunit EhuC [Prauserella marina]ASR37786.1 ectoine/hydroxyectoine ABC transporter permease subunit EhuC [Prauserella marina]PWV75740.1 amino acid ABC transporter membrane protein 1 (PAAT family) [Prauserella marina]SDD27387.1 polar amino acid transport system permease protein [Prauserella marina]